jgi:single-strand DNA-binding protein
MFAVSINYSFKTNNMNSLRNSVRLIGHLGETPKVKKLENGKMVANFSIATNEIYKNGNNEKISDTTWHKLVAWGKSAEIAEQYLKQGSEVAIEGRLTNRTYENKEGEKQYISEVLVNSILLMDKKN